MKKYHILWLVLFIIPNGAAQTELGWQEDYEDDTLGSSTPTGDGYTFVFNQGSDPVTVAVTSPGLDGTNQKLSWTQTATGSGFGTATWTFDNAGQIESIDMFFGCAGGGQQHQMFIGGAGGNAIGWLVFNCAIAQSTGAGCSTSPPSLRGTGNTNFHLVLTFDWTAKTYVYEENGVPTTVPFCNAGTTSLSNMQLHTTNSCSGSCGGTLNFDQMIIDGGSTAPIEATSPSEFDAGIKQFITGLGFITFNSQFLFSLILIALATIGGAGLTAWFGSGGWRNWLIFGLAALVGVMSVLLGWIKLWMFVIAIVLGGVATQGGRETRDTWTALIRARAREPEIDPVEAAFRRLEDQPDFRENFTVSDELPEPVGDEEPVPEEPVQEATEDDKE